MATQSLPVFHETLSAALSALAEHLQARAIVMADSQSLFRAYEFDGIAYGESKSADGEIATIKGKGTKKWGHVTVWRSNSGRYEINFYVL